MVPGWDMGYLESGFLVVRNETARQSIVHVELVIS